MKYISIIICFLFLEFSAIALFRMKYLTSFILCSSIITGYYAMRIFDFDIVKSLNDLFIRISIGGFLSSVFVVVIFISFREFIDKMHVMYLYFIQIVFITIILAILIEIHKNQINTKKTLVVGKQEEFGNILHEIEKKSFKKYHFSQFCEAQDSNINKVFDEFFFGEYSKKQEYTLLICDPVIEKNIKDLTNKLMRKNIQVEYLPDLCERYLRRIPVEIAEKFEDYYQIIFVQSNNTPDKRILDIILSLIAIIILIPLFIILSLLIIIEDRFPFIYTQKRVGYRNQLYTIHKLRSMKIANKKNELFASQEKQRILLIGKIMRPFRLDEILQFFDILCGKMSLIGPRPEQESFVKEYEEKIPFYTFRHQVKPGLSGWAQIMYSYASNLEESKIKYSYDLYYLKNRSFVFDLEIILKTIETVLFRKGAI